MLALPRLRRLHLGRCPIGPLLPAAFTGLTTLTELGLHSCGLEKLPGDFGNLARHPAPLPHRVLNHRPHVILRSEAGGRWRIAQTREDGQMVHSVLCEAGERIRYLNPSDTEPCEYWAVCAPAFSPDTVHREG